MSESARNINVFVGRRAELERFKQVLRGFEMRQGVSTTAIDAGPAADWYDDEGEPPTNRELPHIILISGHGGLGKSRLLERLHSIAVKAGAASVCQTLPIIRWEEVGGAASGRDQVDELAALHSLARKLRALGELASYPAASAPTAPPIIHTGEVESVGGQLAVGSQIAQTHIAAAENIYINPAHSADERQRQEQFAGERIALASDLRRISLECPLVIFLDTYELVDVADEALRPLYLESGPRVMWVIAGRNNLIPDRPGATAPLFRGYAGAGLGAKLHNFALSALGMADIKNYFQKLGREIDDQQAQAIYRETCGNALALAIAAGMYVAGQPLANIIAAQDTPLLRRLSNTATATGDDELAYQMVNRLLFYCTSEEDRQLLYALALANRPEVGLLEAMTGATGSLRPLLEDLARRYDFVFVRERRLHDTVRHFMLAYLVSENGAGTERDSLRRLNERASSFSLAALRERERELGTTDLGELTWDEEWSERLLDYLHHRLWLAPEAGSYDALVAICTAYGYRQHLNPHVIRNSVVEVIPTYNRTIGWWKGALEPGILAWKYASGYWQVSEAAGDLRDLMCKFNGRTVSWHPCPDEGWGVAYAVLCWREGQEWDPYVDENDHYYQSTAEERDVLEEAVKWYRDGLAACTKVQDLNTSAGFAFLNAGHYEEAVSSYTLAIAIEPAVAWFYRGRGMAYHKLGDKDAAIRDYEKSTQLRSDDANAQYELACLFAATAKGEQALLALRRAESLRPGHARLAHRTEEFTQLAAQSLSFAQEFDQLLVNAEANVPEADVLDQALREWMKGKAPTLLDLVQVMSGYTVRLRCIHISTAEVTLGLHITRQGSEELEVKATLTDDGGGEYLQEMMGMTMPLGIEAAAVQLEFKVMRPPTNAATFRLALEIGHRPASARYHYAAVPGTFRFDFAVSGDDE